MTASPPTGRRPSRSTVATRPGMKSGRPLRETGASLHNPVLTRQAALANDGARGIKRGEIHDCKRNGRLREFTSCNCAYGCPCQFDALPSYGNCDGVAAFHVDHGKHGELTLDGLNCVLMVRWPGAIHQGNGEAAV